MNNFVNLVYNEARLQVVDMRQYWFETLGGFVFLTAMFIGLFYGVSTFAQPDPQVNSLDGLVFGFILWIFASGTYNSVTRTIIEDTQKGYIEQLFLCPSGFTCVLLAKAMVDMLVTIVSVLILAHLAMWLSGNWLEISFLRFFGVMVIAAPSLIGLGFIMCGLTLIFKRIETVSAIMNFAF